MMKIYLCFKLFVIAALMYPFNSFAQKGTTKNSMSLGLHYAILGEGDYNGYAITNQYNREMFSFLEISLSLGFLSSSRENNIGYIETYLANHLMLDLPVYIVPVNSKYFFVKIGGSGMIRLRREVLATGVYYDNIGIIEKVILKESNWDKGYSIQAILGTNIGQKTSISTRISLQNYNRGTQVVMFGIIAAHKL